MPVGPHTTEGFDGKLAELCAGEDTALRSGQGQEMAGYVDASSHVAILR